MNATKAMPQSKKPTIMNGAGDGLVNGVERERERE